MARTASKPKTLTYAVSYGFMGGPLHGRKLNRLMHQNGYALRKTEEADIIIAHSGGCWLIPTNSHPKLVVYVGLPLNTAKPRRTLRQARTFMYQHGTLASNMRRNLKSLYYGARQPRRNLGFLRMAKTAKPVILPGVPAIFITNRDDPWPQAAALEDLVNAMPWAFINLPGAHDDLKENPVRYVEIINHYARLLG